MHQVGNLAIICAQRSDLTFVMLRGLVNVIVRSGESSYDTLIAYWNDNESINAMIHELNFGKYAKPSARGEDYE